MIPFGPFSKEETPLAKFASQTGSIGIISAALLMFVLGLSSSAVHGAMTVDEVVATHAATLAKIETIYLRVEISHGDIGKPLQRMSSSESWRSGTRVRTSQRLFVALTVKGIKEIPEEDRVTQFSFADSESRSLRGWDPEAPFTLPLDETRNANEFGRVKGGLGPRDPLGSTSGDWAALLLEVTTGQPLALFARTAQLALDESPAADVVRLRIAQTDQANLSGGLIDLDPKHGHMIRRLEFPAMKTVAEVQGFTDFGDGIWLADKVVRTTPGVTAVVERLEARVNQPIADADLVVAFPEGARVEEVLTKRVHLWGKDGPAETFDSFPQFLEYQQKRMKAAHPLPGNPANGGANWLLWVNVTGIAALLMLMVFRKRLVQP